MKQTIFIVSYRYLFLYATDIKNYKFKKSQDLFKWAPAQ